MGKWLEARAKGKTSEAIKKLMGLQETARVIRDGQTSDIPVEAVVAGDLVVEYVREKDSRRRRGHERAFIRRRVHAHGGKHSGGEEGRRSRYRIYNQQKRKLRSSRLRASARNGARANHSSHRRCARVEGDSGTCRPCFPRGSCPR